MNPGTPPKRFSHARQPPIPTMTPPIPRKDAGTIAAASMPTEGTVMALILLVDDSHLGRTLAHLTLTRAGHRVIVARDGREGLDLAQAHNPDLIVAACTLPVLDGVTMVRSLRSRGIAPPVILVGSGPGWVDGGARNEAWDGTEIISISRSIEPHELTRAVQTALRPVVAKAA